MTGKQAIVLDAGLDGWLVYIPEFDVYRRDREDRPTLSNHAGGELREGHKRGWWVSDVEPKSVHWTKSENQYKDTHILRRPELHDVDPERWPLTLPRGADWEDFNSDDYELPFEAVQVAHDVDLSDAVRPSDSVHWRKAAPPSAEWQERWQPKLLPTVLHGEGLGPWLPGKLVGFRVHMASIVGARGEVFDVYCKGVGSGYEPAEGPLFRVRQSWSDGRTTKVKPTPRSRKLVDKATWITIEVPLFDVPVSIEGIDLWEAVKKWEQAEVDWLHKWDLIGAKACSACDGRGWVRS